MVFGFSRLRIWLASITFSLLAASGPALAITVTAGGIEGNLNISGGTTIGSGSNAQLSVGGYLFDPANITGGSGDGNCNLFGGKCIQLSTNPTTTMTTDPAGGIFSLLKLSFVLDGAPSELSVFGFVLNADGGTLKMDVTAGSCTPSAFVFCVAKNTWYTIDFGGLFDDVDRIVFDNTGTGNMRIGALLVTPIPVPLPAGGLLFLSALGGLGLVRPRKRKATLA